MSISKWITFCAIAAFICGCSSLGGKEPFQIYDPKTDCVSCKKQENWGFVKKNIYRNKKDAYLASYELRSSGNRPLRLEYMGLCYGTAIDTIKSGATHFRILDKGKMGDWQEMSTPASISGPNILGTYNIYPGGTRKVNRDLSGMGLINHYYEIGSPNCGSSTETCSKKHGFNLQDCPYEGDELRKETEEKKGSLACVMKRNPRLLLHEVYSEMAGCGDSVDSVNTTASMNDLLRRYGEVDYWVPAKDVVKKLEGFFEQNNTDR